MTELLPISALVPTRHRSISFRRTLESLAQQAVQPLELIVVDGSNDSETELICQQSVSGLLTQIRYYRADELGAATQRNQAFVRATQPFIWLMDDDILLEPDCVSRMWNALHHDPCLGGVNAMIINQRYLPPGYISRSLFHFLHGRPEATYAGKCIGPAFNLLPEDRPELPDVVPVEWLNTTCTLYRREALPQPMFDSWFTGYSLMEDVALSLTVGKRWKLANARTARIFHDSQPGDHKSNIRALSGMELINRYYVMTKVLERQRLSDYLKLLVVEIFSIVASLSSLKNWLALWQQMMGKLDALRKIWILSCQGESLDD
jgi:glycosyltransferase involved in cell wall biosynthesis